MSFIRPAHIHDKQSSKNHDEENSSQDPPQRRVIGSHGLRTIDSESSLKEIIVKLEKFTQANSWRKQKTNDITSAFHIKEI